MKAARSVPTDIDEYIASAPAEVQPILKKIRLAIKQAAPEAEETISYSMPTFNLNGHYLVYFAAYKKHISLYPAPVGVPGFEKELALYGASKGTMQFPYDKPIPFALIARLVKYRVQENRARPALKAKTG